MRHSLTLVQANLMSITGMPNDGILSQSVETHVDGIRLGDVYQIPRQCELLEAKVRVLGQRGIAVKLSYQRESRTS